MILKKMRISHRLMLSIPVLFLALAASLILALQNLHQSLLRERQEMTKELVQVAVGVAQNWKSKVKPGGLTDPQAQDGAKEELRGIRFGDDNYFFIQKYDGVVVLNPNKPALEGQNRMETGVDADGVPQVKLQIEAAKAGGGWVPYRFTRVGTAQPVPKLSYAVGFKDWEWAMGTGIYIDDVDAIYYATALKYTVVVATILSLAAALAYLIARSIRQPLLLITERMGRLAEGHLDIEVPFLGDPNELGLLARALNVFKNNRRKADELAAAQHAEQEAKLHRQQTVERLMADFHQRSARVIEAVARAAEGVQTHARRLADMARDSKTSIEAVGHAALDTTGNVQAVAGAAEELSAAVGDVNRRVVKSTDIVKRAVSETDRTNATMRGLVDAAHRIGTIVKVIQDIASQTNLLALNATIEAARAGDAGKGFAVVAGEVKTLANQTTKATEEIQAQVGAIQSETGRAVEAIGNIGKTVDEMSEISTAIASAMEQQGATTHDIARNINQAADRTREVSTNVRSVGDAAETTSTAAGELQQASDDLRGQAAQLETEMKQFLGQMRAA
jgi:methyl-accepting chemotaxis protein